MKSLLVIALVCYCVASLCGGDDINEPINADARVARTFRIRSSSLDLTTLGGKKYFFSKIQLFNWVEAAAYCRLYDMNLASIETKEEDDLITNQLVNIGLKSNWVWISGSKFASSAYTWINGAPFTYTNWFTGQPDNVLGTEYCAVTWDGKWHDLNCLTRTYFICEEEHDPDVVIGK